MGECRGGDWENAVIHVLFTSNPTIVLSGFRPGGLKRLEMLLRLGISFMKNAEHGDVYENRVYLCN
jgi:hypothetical protein